VPVRAEPRKRASPSPDTIVSTAQCHGGCGGNERGVDVGAGLSGIIKERAEAVHIEHERIIAAIEKRDPDDAERLMRAHLSATGADGPARRLCARTFCVEGEEAIRDHSPRAPTLSSDWEAPSVATDHFKLRLGLARLTS
jgi:hypothetical protein